MERNEFYDKAEKARDYLRPRLEGLKLRFGIGAGRYGYKVDPVGAEIKFMEAGATRVTAGLQVVGVLYPDTQTWVWGWAQPELPAAVQVSAAALKRFGEENAVEELTVESASPATEVEAWALTAFAAQQLGAEGAYVCKGGDFQLRDGGKVFALLAGVREASRIILL